MSNNVHAATSLIGGGNGALDAIDGNDIVDGDVAVVFVDGGNVYNYVLDAASGATESSPTVISPDNNAGTKRWVLTQPYDQYVKVSDQKASGTAGGSGTTGSYATRDLNTEDSDTSGIASLATNQITLPAGTYRCYITVPAYAVTSHKAQLYNVTGAATLILGSTAYASGTSESIISGVFTLSVESALDVRHRITTAASTNDLGIAATYGDVETYTQAEFWKLI